MGKGTSSASFTRWNNGAETRDQAFQRALRDGRTVEQALAGERAVQTLREMFRQVSDMNVETTIGDVKRRLGKLYGVTGKRNEEVLNSEINSASREIMFGMQDGSRRTLGTILSLGRRANAIRASIERLPDATKLSDEFSVVERIGALAAATLKFSRQVGYRANTQGARERVARLR